MNFSLIIRSLCLLSIFYIYSPVSLAIEESNKNNPQAYIDFATKHQNSSPAKAANALEEAYFLAERLDNKVLIVKTLIAQALLAKSQKDYYLGQQFLNKAEIITSSLNNNDLTVQVLTNMSAIQRYLKNYDNSMDYVQRALVIAKESNDPKLIFTSLFIKGTLLKTTKRVDDSIATYLSAQRYISSVTYPEKVSLFRDIAGAYIKVNEYESAIRYYNKALNVLNENSDYKSLPKTLIDIAKTHNKMGEYALALENISRSLQLAREYKDEKLTVKSLVVLSILYRKLGSYENSLKAGLEALDIYQSKNDLNGIASAANAIGLIYLNLGQNKNAMTYFEQVIALPENKIQKKYRAAALRDLGELIFAQNQDIKGLDLSNQAFAIYEKIGNRKGVATVQRNIASIYYQKGNLAEAMNSFNTAINLFNKIGDVWNEAKTKVQLANVIAKTDIEETIKLANESLKQANEIGAKSIAVKAYAALILAEESRKDYYQALMYSKKKEELIHELKTESLNNRLAEMHIILQVEKKEKALEKLKHEKSVISLELANQENNFNLLEKEKTINDLTNQNTLIILSVTCMAVILCLFIIGRVYFNMHYRFILFFIIAFILLFYTFNANSTDIIKIPKTQSSLDVRPKYTHAVLRKALDMSMDKYGDYEIKVSKHSMNNFEQIMEVHDGIHINLTMAMSSPDWEYLALPIRIPIRRGIANYRLLAINKNNQEKFKNIETLEQLKALKVGSQKEWIINNILDDEGFSIIESTSYDGVFRMLEKNRFDFILRGIHEGFDEVKIRKDDLPNLMIEPHLAVYIPQPYYIFVSPKTPRIAERVTYGLEKMVSQGTLKQMFEEHYGSYIKKANLANRTIIHVGNRFLPQKTPVNSKELWMLFDVDKPN